MKGLAVVALLVMVSVSYALDVTMEVRSNNDVRVTLHNKQTNEDIHVLVWSSPLEGPELNSNLFEVTSPEGETAHYIGRLYKRASPSHANFVRISAGSTVTTTLAVDDAYFTPTPGNYTIRFRAHIGVIRAASLPTTQEMLVDAIEYVYISTPKHTMTVHTPDQVPKGANQVVPNALKFTDCSDSQKSIITSAVGVDTPDASQALACLQKNTCPKAFSRWFGVYNASRYSRVQQHFTNIVRVLNERSFGFACDCDSPGTYAYVLPIDVTKTIHLCPVFWEASPKSHTFNSQPGTITHELSHFLFIGSTDDIQYGTVPCRALAVTNPNGATRNADSHEFFQEGNPTD